MKKDILKCWEVREMEGLIAERGLCCVAPGEGAQAKEEKRRNDRAQHNLCQPFQRRNGEWWLLVWCASFPTEST
jgi:hypothetical protein